MADVASKDDNSVASLLGVSSSDGKSTVKIYANPTTHRLLIDTGASAATATTWGSTGNTSTITDATITASTMLVFMCATPPKGFWGVVCGAGSATITSSDIENGTLAFTYKVLS